MKREEEDYIPETGAINITITCLPGSINARPGDHS